AALGLRNESNADDADALTRRLVARLSDGGSLLVLDNCEHLLDAAAAVVQILLQRCPGLRVLATSRQRLGLLGEVAWRVPSLPVPDLGEGPRVKGQGSRVDDPSRPPSTLDRPEGTRPSTLMQFAAVRLFVERAAAVHPGFRLTNSAEEAAVG